MTVENDCAQIIVTTATNGTSGGTSANLFSTGSVPRCFEQDELLVTVSGKSYRDRVQRRMGGRREEAARIGVSGSTDCSEGCQVWTWQRKQMSLVKTGGSQDVL
jgi:hypothetical protein